MQRKIRPVLILTALLLITGLQTGTAGIDNGETVPYVMQMEKAGGTWTCELRITEKPHSGFVNQYKQTLEELKMRNRSPSVEILETDDDASDGITGFVYRQGDEIHAEFRRVTPSGVGVHLLTTGENGVRQMMIQKSESLIQSINFRKRATGDGKAMYQALRTRILPPVGIDRYAVEAVFGTPDRRVTSMEPISNVPLPHDQYDIARSEGKNYYLCVKYDDSRAAWVYLANMDDAGLPGGMSDREIDYWDGIRKLELMEALWGDMLADAPWRSSVSDGP